MMKFEGIQLSRIWWFLISKVASQGVLCFENSVDRMQVGGKNESTVGVFFKKKKSKEYNDELYLATGKVCCTKKHELLQFGGRKMVARVHQPDALHLGGKC